MDDNVPNNDEIQDAMVISVRESLKLISKKAESIGLHESKAQWLFSARAVNLLFAYHYEFNIKEAIGATAGLTPNQETSK